MKFDKKQRLFLLGLIMLVAFFFRSYHHQEWLFFKWDQARDAKLLAVAVEKGPEHLPLLGPRATKLSNGDYLRLGPAYYYLMYLSGAIFDSVRPEVFAYPDLLLAVLTIPLLYLFFALYFSRRNSLLLAAMYAVCFLIVQYSRFSWNPNSVPFFLVLSFYGMLRFFREKDFGKKKMVWLSLWMLGLIIASQFHFFAFFSLIGISGLFVFWKIKPWQKVFFQNVFTKKALKIFLVVVAVVGVFYAPMVISEIKSGGQNTKNFFLAFKDKPKDKPFSQKLMRNIREQGRGYFLLTTSYDYKKSEKNHFLVSAWAGCFFILAGLFLAIRAYRKEKQSEKRDFLLLISIWTIFFFLVTIPMAYQLRPRFFVVVFPLAFIFFGFWFNLFSELFGSKERWLVGAVFASFIFLNVNGTLAWFKENALSQDNSLEVNRTLILKKKDGVTLGQLEALTKKIKEESAGDFFYYYAKPEYQSVVEYLLLLEGVPREQFSPLDQISESEKVSIKAGAPIFLMVSAKSGFASAKKELRNLVLPKEEFQFGQLKLINSGLREDWQKFVLPDKAVVVSSLEEVPADAEGDGLDDVVETEEPAVIQGKSARIFWRDIFGTDESPKEVEEILSR